MYGTAAAAEQQLHSTTNEQTVERIKKERKKKKNTERVYPKHGTAKKHFMNIRALIRCRYIHITIQHSHTVRAR